jgi:ABC-type transport system substrate-binding protein
MEGISAVAEPGKSPLASPLRKEGTVWVLPRRLFNAALGSDNWGRLSEPAVDRLFEQVELDEQKRAQLVRELQKEVLKKAWWIPGL